MSLQARQDEWSELYNADSIKQKCTEQTAEIFGSLTQADKFKLSAIWISDGISARHIDYPKSPKELQYMNWSRSRFIRNLFNFAVIFQTFAPFFEAPYCNQVKHSYKSGELFVNGAPTRFALSLLDMLLLGVYATDLYLVFSINPSRKSFTRKPWSTFRFLMCIFILIDCIVYFIDESQPRICRCIYPFLLIARRNNLKLMSQGLLQSGYHSLNIIKALFSVLVLWGFVGFVLFRNVDSDTSRFSNPLEGFYTALHCFTSRPYVLKALSPLFSVNEASTVFFVTLTLAADILCINLIVAVGSRQYKLFAASVFQQRLVDRRNAISCAFYAAANGNQRLNKSDWLQVCEHITGKYGTAALTAGFIFDLVLQSDQLAQDAAARLQEAIDAQDDDEEEGDSEQQEECVARKSRATGARSFSMRSQSVDEELFFRCCALVAARLQIQGAAATDKKRAVQKRISKVNSLVPDKSAQQQAQQRNTMLLSSSIDSDIGSGLALGVTTDIQVTIDNTDEIRETFISNLNPKEVNVTVHNIPTVVPTSPAGVVDSNLSPDYKTNTADFTNRLSAFSIAESVQEAPVRPGLLAWVWTKVQHACVVITSFQVTVKLGPFQEPQPINVFHSIFLFMHVLLVIQLSFVSAPSRNTAWFNLGWFLEDFFLLYMIVKVVSSGVRRYLSFYDNLVDVSINFAVFVLLVVLGESYLQSDYEFSMSPAMSAYLLVQLLRLFKLFFLVNDIEIFEHILPVLLRSSFILFSVVYFFSIFGYSYFCSALNPDDVEGSSENDDASQWLSYENLLNFSSNLHSLFTLFEMGILGNWSMVMDAAALSSNPYSAFIFFYTYRLLITLCVLPILLSFILQAFLSALSKKAKSVATQERAQNQEQGDADDPDDAVVKEETVRMSKANLVDCDNNDSGSDSEQATHEPVVSSKRVSFNVSKGGGEVDYDSALEDDDLSRSSEPAVTAANPMQSPNRESVAASSPDSRPTVFRTSEMTSKTATQAPALSPKRMSTIQFGVDRNLAGRSKNINTESIAPAAKKDGRPQSLKSSGSGGGKGGLQHTNKEITVQYDNNSSSMVSIWAQDSAPHSNSGSNSSNSGKSKNGVSPISSSHNTTAAGGVASSSNNVYEEQVRSLQKQLDEALLELRLERERHR